MTPILRLAAAMLALASQAQAAVTCPASEGRPILEVSGRIGCESADGSASFDIGQLGELDPVTIETSTMWTEGVHSFTGVPLARLLDAVSADGRAIRAYAINDYAIEIPRQDWADGGPIVAYLADGEPMPVRNKGPLWIVYPWDDRPEYKNEATYSRSIWQLKRIEVLD